MPSQSRRSSVGVLTASSTALYDCAARRERAIERLASEYQLRRVVIPERVRALSGRVGAQDAKAVARQFHEMHEDEDIAWIVSSIGGFNTNAVLPHLDWRFLSRNPKLLCGYSDTSALLNALHRKTGAVTLHGPSLMAQWGDPQGPFSETLESLTSAIDDQPIELAFPGYWCDPRCDWSREESFHDKVRRFDGWKTFRQGICRGRLIGGNLETVNMLMGTEFEPDFTGRIVFVEATGAEAHLPRFYRALTHLASCGAFQKSAGVMIGRFQEQPEAMEASLADVLELVFGESRVPIVYDVDLGHTEPMVTLPIGRDAELVAEEGYVVISIRG